MLRIFWEIHKKGLQGGDIAASAGITPETLSRIVHGKQKPSFANGGSAERIAQAVGWTGDVRELFERVEVR